MRQKERNKTRFYDRDQQVVNMEEEEGILFSRGVEIHVDKCLRFYCGVPKFRGARRLLYTQNLNVCLKSSNDCA